MLFHITIFLCGKELSHFGFALGVTFFISTTMKKQEFEELQSNIWSEASKIMDELQAASDGKIDLNFIQKSNNWKRVAMLFYQSHYLTAKNCDVIFKESDTDIKNAFKDIVKDLGDWANELEKYEEE